MNEEVVERDDGDGDDEEDEVTEVSWTTRTAASATASAAISTLTMTLVLVGLFLRITPLFPSRLSKAVFLLLLLSFSENSKN